MTEIEAVELEELAALARQTVDVLVDGVEHEAEYPLVCGFALALFGDLEREGKLLHLAFIRTHRVQLVYHGVPRRTCIVYKHTISQHHIFGEFGAFQRRAIKKCSIPYVLHASGDNYAFKRTATGKSVLLYLRHTHGDDNIHQRVTVIKHMRGNDIYSVI